MKLCYPDNIEKYSGTILEKDNFYQYLNKCNNNLIYENFYYKKYKTKNDCYDDALKYMKDYCKKKDMVLNKYIKKNNYLIVYLNIQDKFLLVDLEFEELINKYNWRLQNRITYPITKDSSGNFIPFHELAFHHKHVIHKNGNKLDNRYSNVELVNEKQLSWNLKHKNRKKRNDNISGTTGVCKTNVGKYEYWEVRGIDYQQNKIMKRFSVKKYGDLGAKSMAITYRKEHIDQSKK